MSTHQSIAAEIAADPAIAARFALKRDDTGPTVNVRFANAIGGWHLRTASVLARYPDGRVRVLMHDTHVRHVVHPNSVLEA